MTEVAGVKIVISLYVRRDPSWAICLEYVLQYNLLPQVVIARLIPLDGHKILRPRALVKLNIVNRGPLSVLYTYRLLDKILLSCHIRIES